MTKYKAGEIIKGVVSGIENYGMFVKVDESYTGLIHISEISESFVRDVNDYAKIGDTIYVEILDIDSKNCQLKLSIKNIAYKNGIKYTKRKIVETSQGFKTLEYNLPLWIEENLKKHKKETKSIDK